MVGSLWSYDEPLLDLEFDGPAPDMDSSTRQIILEQVREDLEMLLPTADENIYGYGKQVARLAQLTHIADQLKHDDEDTSSEDSGLDIFDHASSLLAENLQQFLSVEVKDKLLFDSNLGGMVSKDGLSDKDEDFGNGR